MSRTTKSINNLAYATIGQLLGMIISFISRIFFIRTLGNEYLGINGLFSNVLTVLSLAELGIGTAITYSLYKPLAEKDTIQCKKLMKLYRNIYIIIGIIIIILGIAMMPFLSFFVKNKTDFSNLNDIYFLFIINTAISYFFSYKRDFIIADQNRYIATIYRYSFYIIVNIVQIIYLFINKNYIGYLIIQIIGTFLENILISKKANKMYPYLKEKIDDPLDNKTKQEIIKNTKAMMIHKVGGVIVNSTDNILLSMFVNLSSVGIYSNYSLIITALNTVIGQIYSSITASVGNLCASSNKEKQYTIYKKINFLTFWIHSFSSVCLLNLFNPFIEIWLGSDYLFNIEIVTILVINFYLSGMRKATLTFREATGLFEKDKYKAIIESIINLVTSIILVKKIGVLGIFIGTFISSITTCVWVEPYILYKYGFNKNVIEYFKIYIKELIITILIMLLTYEICSLIKLNIYLAFIVKCLICFSIPNIILYFLFRKSDNFKYFNDNYLNILIKKFIKRELIK